MPRTGSGITANEKRRERKRTDKDFKDKRNKERTNWEERNKDKRLNQQRMWRKMMNKYANKRCKKCGKLLNYRTKGKYCRKHIGLNINTIEKEVKDIR